MSNIWITPDKQEIEITEMSDMHLRSLILSCRKAAETILSSRVLSPSKDAIDRQANEVSDNRFQALLNEELRRKEQAKNTVRGPRRLIL